MARSTPAKSKGTSSDQRIEWVIGIASGAVTLGLIAFLLFEAFAGSDSSPALRVEAAPVRQVGEHYALDLRVVNHGGTTASDVVVEGRLGAGDDVEVSSVTLDYVPPGPGITATLVFGADPADRPLVLSVKGFTRP